MPLAREQERPVQSKGALTASPTGRVKGYFSQVEAVILHVQDAGPTLAGRCPILLPGDVQVKVRTRGLGNLHTCLWECGWQQ